MWLDNPEQAKLRRELPFLAAALECCVSHISQEALDKRENKLEREMRKEFTSRQQRVQDQWAKHKAKQRTQHKGNERPRGPNGQFLKEAK